MELIRSSETPVSFYSVTRNHLPEEDTFLGITGVSLCPSSGILKRLGEHNLWGTGVVPSPGQAVEHLHFMVR